MNELLKVRIEDASGNSTGGTRIVLGDQDITKHVRSISLGMMHREPTTVIIEFTNVQVEADVLALVERMVTSDHVAQVLDSLDPNRVEQEVLQALGMGDKMVPALIKYIKEKVRES